MHLNDLRFMPNSMRGKKRVARGQGGKATGRGLKGQKARSGVSLGNFQGGQTPLERRVPKHNFMKKKRDVVAVSLNRLAICFEKNLFSSDFVTKDRLVDLRFIKKTDKYKIIGHIDRRVEIEANSFSKGAEAAIKSAGGSVKIIGDVNDK